MSVPAQFAGVMPNSRPPQAVKKGAAQEAADEAELERQSFVVGQGLAEARTRVLAEARASAASKAQQKEQESQKESGS